MNSGQGLGPRSIGAPQCRQIHCGAKQWVIAVRSAAGGGSDRLTSVASSASTAARVASTAGPSAANRLEYSLWPGLSPQR